jgi:hypothetical protein
MWVNVTIGNNFRFYKIKYADLNKNIKSSEDLVDWIIGMQNSFG